MTNKPINNQKQNTAKNSSTNASSNTSSEKAVPVAERQNLTKSSTKTAPTITARDEYYVKKYAYKDIYMTDAEVQRFEDRFWKDIQDYRVSKGYPKFKKNAELTNLANQVALPGTPEFKSLGNMVSQNYQHIGEFLPGLTRLGLNMANSFSYTDAIGNDSRFSVYYGTWSNIKTPEAKADRLFNMFKTSGKNYELPLLTGMKERYAYGAISARFYYDDIHGDLNGIGFTLISADGTSPEWIEAWNNAD